MADRDKPKTHVEDDKDVDLPRKQPESPRHEGIDPLTEGDTMYPKEDVKGDANKTEKAEAREAEEDLKNGEDSTEDQASADLAADQEERDARANTPDSSLPDEDKTAPANKTDGKTSSTSTTKSNK